MSEESDLEKTEQPSPRRLEKARGEGQVARSKEWVTFALLSTAMAGLWMSAELLEGRITFAFQRGLGFERAVGFDTNRMLTQALELAGQGLIAIAPWFAMMLVTALIAPTMLGGLLFSPKSLMPKFAKLNPLAGLGRMFSQQSVAELLKSIAKSGLIGLVAYFVLKSGFDSMMALMSEPIRVAVPHMVGLVARSCFWILGALLLIALVDVPYQVWALHKKLRMSRQEVKEEHKESEGDPHVKARIRRQQQEMARKRMMSEVPKADVVVTNPTHFAVALMYNDKMAAPKVIAKGTDLVAERIKDLAREHKIQVVESAALARSLYKHTDLNRDIPRGLYGAVAELLAWVYRLRRWQQEGGERPQAPAEPQIPDALQYSGTNPV